MAYYYPPAGSGSGDVVGPASATDHALVRYDLTTGKLVQNSTAILNDGTLTGSSGTSAFLNLPFTVNQSGTAGYTGLVVRATETATGSGTKLLMQLGTAASNSLCTIDNTGILKTVFLGVGDAPAPDISSPLAVYGNRNDINQIECYNRNAGSAASSAFIVRSDEASGAFAAQSAAFTSTGLQLADGIRLTSGTTASGGLVVGTRANAALQFGTNDTLRGGITGGGQFVLAPVALTQAAPTVIDFNLANERDITLTGDIEFTTSNLAAGRSVTVYITCDGTGRNFTFPAWVFVGTEPTAIAANKRAVLTLSARSTTDASVRAAYSVEA